VTGIPTVWPGPAAGPPITVSAPGSAAVLQSNPYNPFHEPLQYQDMQTRMISPPNQSNIHTTISSYVPGSLPPRPPMPHHSAGREWPSPFMLQPSAEFPHPAKLAIQKTRHQEPRGTEVPGLSQGKPAPSDDAPLQSSAATDKEVSSDKASTVRLWQPKTPEKHAATGAEGLTEPTEKIGSPSPVAAGTPCPHKEIPQPAMEKYQDEHPPSPPEDVDPGTVIRRPAKKNRKRLPSTWAQQGASSEVTAEVESTPREEDAGMPVGDQTANGEAKAEKQRRKKKTNNKKRSDSQASTQEHAGASAAQVHGGVNPQEPVAESTAPV